MSRNFGLPQKSPDRANSSWPMWVAALVAIGVIDIALHLPRPA
jgi:hypothetical protein